MGILFYSVGSILINFYLGPTTTITQTWPSYVAAGWWWWMMGQVILLDTDISVQYQDWNIYILTLLFYPLVWSSTDKYVWYNCKNYRKLCQLMPIYASLDQLMPAWSALVTPWKILGVCNYIDLSLRAIQDAHSWCPDYPRTIQGYPGHPELT